MRRNNNNNGTVWLNRAPNKTTTKKKPANKRTNSIFGFVKWMMMIMIMMMVLIIMFSYSKDFVENDFNISDPTDHNNIKNNKKKTMKVFTKRSSSRLFEFTILLAI